MEKEILLNAKDLCDIVTACGTSGVKSLKLGSLEISFGDSEPKVTTQIKYVMSEPEATTSPPSLTSPYEKPEEEPHPLDHEDLYLTNPTQWEELGTRRD